jgi:hypothetical protein
MCEAFEAACKELGDDIGQSGEAREVIARRILPRQNLVSVTRFACRQPRSANRTNDPFVQALARSRSRGRPSRGAGRPSFTSKVH